MNDNNKDFLQQKSPLGDFGVSLHPANHYKFCPRCASSGNFSNEKLSFKCPVCDFHFFINSAAAVMSVIYNSKGELLFVKRGVEPSIGMYDLPGGFVDPGENAESALLREIKEELNLSLSSFSFYTSFPNKYPFSGTIVYTVDMVFICHVSDFSEMKFGDDIIGIEFIKPDEIDFEFVPFDSVRNLLKKLINERNHLFKD